MSDFETEPMVSDVSSELVPPEIEAFMTTEELEAIEFGDLNANRDERDIYTFTCVMRGLNPHTQEPWTDEEVADHIDRCKWDPRSVESWFEDADYVKSLYERFLHEKRRKGREQ